MHRLFIVRHCEATGQTPEAPLTENGKNQALNLSRWFQDYKVDHVVTSPFHRTRASIQPLAELRGLMPVSDDRLRERVLSDSNLTDWKDQLKKTFEDLDLRLPGGETSREAMHRAVAVVKELQKKTFKQIVLVTHGNLMTLLLKHFDASFGFTAWEQLTNPDVYVVEFHSPDSIGPIVKRLWHPQGADPCRTHILD